MTHHGGPTRALRCGRCGARFFCRPTGGCWCATAAVRLPVPDAGADCLCRACLRAVARSEPGGRIESSG